MSKLTPLERSLGSIMGIIYAIGRQLVIRSDSKSKKILDVIDPDFITSKGLSPTIRNVLTPEAKAIISARIEEGKSEQKIAEALVTDPTFLNSISNIFTPYYLGFFTIPPVEGKEEEPAPEVVAPAPEVVVPAPEEKQKEADAEDDADMIQLAELKQQRDELIRLSMIGGPDIAGPSDVIDAPMAVRTKRKTKKKSVKGKKTYTETVSDFDKRIDTLETKMAEDAKRTADRTAEEAMRATERNQAITQSLADIKLNTNQIMSGISENKQLNAIRERIDQKIDKNKKSFKGLKIDKKTAEELIKTIPKENRAILGPAIRGITGDTIDLNSAISGLVGLAVSAMATPTAGAIVSPLINNILRASGVDLTSYLLRSSSDGDDNDILPTNAPQTTPELMSRLDRLDNYVRSLQRPTDTDVTRGIIGGALSTAATAVQTSGSVGNLFPGLMPGAIMGGAVSSITSPMIEEYFRERGARVDEQLRRKIEMIKFLPPALIGAYLGYTAPGSDVIGTGVVSGAGITERKLIASPDVVQQTQVQETQQGGSNKIWQPKSIFPTTDILNESNQEKYADDVEFIAFNYIAPTSEGGYGTVDTNPLKRSQATAEALRFTDSGVSVPFLLWNQVNNANDMTPQQLEKLALGVELPPMEFMAQDNEETFEEVARLQYPNNELMAVEFLSPYSDFSNVDNFWMTNPDNMLFTINA